MSTSPGSFTPDEIAEDLGSTPDRQAPDVWAAARALERAMPGDPPRPPTDFTARVMAVLENEAAPHAVGFLAGLWARPGIHGLIMSTRQAWATAVTGAGRPLRVRASAIAYVLAIAIATMSVTGVVAVGAAGALGLLSGDHSPTPTILTPSPFPTPSGLTTPSDSAKPSETAEPSGSEDPGESIGPESSFEAGVQQPVKPSESHGPHASDGPGTTPEPSDDSGRAGQTPRPSKSPGASESPH